MKYVITGGTGQIGSRLVQDLVEDGHDVIVLTRNPEHREATVPAEATLAKWDAESATGWVHHADGADVIINFAGENLSGGSFIPKRWTGSIKERIVNSRIKAGHAVVQTIREADQKPALVVQASASGYYGTNLDQDPKTEKAPAGDDWLAQVCQQWEAATDEVEELGVRRIILRTGLILDDNEGVLPRLTLPFKLFAGGTFGSGEQYYPWIHIRDEIRAIRFLMDIEDSSGPYNLSAPDPATNRQMAKALGRVVNRPAWAPVPAFAMKLALGEVATLVLGGQRMVPQRMEQTNFEFKYAELEPALRDLLG
ncbi:MAG: TIGR01777 family oxidoreductase [Anaerolineales bacterium]